MDDSNFISLFKSQFSLFGNQGQKQASLSNIHSSVES